MGFHFLALSFSMEGYRLLGGCRPVVIYNFMR